MILIPILGDQLSHGLASLNGVEKADARLLLMEVAEETTYVRHHKAKIVLILSAMRHFADELRADGWQVDYIRLDDPDNSGSFTGEVTRAVERLRPSFLRIVEAGEWRVQKAIEGWSQSLGIPVEIVADDRFICPLPDFFAWAASRRELVMESFYRQQRRRTGLLMEPDDTPTGGQWNFDKDNRAPPPKGRPLREPQRFSPDAITQEVIALVEGRFRHHFGTLDAFALPVTAAEARALLDDFVNERLPRFGTYQDAMLEGADFLYHSRLSTSLNCGLLTALEVCQAAEAAYRLGTVPLNAAEGFIRQMIGWREYIRGMYWLEMPGLDEVNFFGNTRPLPDFYWTGATDMACCADSVRNTRDNAYAHHIQRLMVLGNFAMLAGIDPSQVADWYLVVYADAYEWVEHPNVLGMSQFADGGRLGTKPYAGSGAYINRMSNYCKGCRFDVKQRVGEDACPFNALYWDFLDRNEAKLRGNRRMWQPYATWNRFGEETKAEVRAQARRFLDSLESAAPGWARAVPGSPYE
ncbi:cryptochrome/photolyase family protein [Sphingomonas glaciei]|uniref:Cryptochrome/photolyase family protein n=1 Tax=Sphingomonas glaciei TaxID=2938948 RepID=A0ABY5MWM1_9SPHN|nr:cryptochrome/photolyase family protein [Sphingomonas glaciei]UUR08391.1 cryptochrome/photolyase family protein [Sphingomonas glaciei]